MRDVCVCVCSLYMCSSDSEYSVDRAGEQRREDHAVYQRPSTSEASTNFS